MDMASWAGYNGRWVICVRHKKQNVGHSLLQQPIFVVYTVNKTSKESKHLPLSVDKFHLWVARSFVGLGMVYNYLPCSCCCCVWVLFEGGM